MPCSSVSKQDEFKKAFISLLFCARQELKTLPSSRWHLPEVPEGRTLLSGLSLCPSCELWVPTPVVGQGWASTSALATGSPKRCLWSPAGRWPRALADRPQGSGMLSGQVGKESRQLSWWNSRLKPYGRMIHANKRGWNIHMGSWFVRQRKIHLLMEKLGQNPMRRAYPVVSAQLQGSCKWGIVFSLFEMLCLLALLWTPGLDLLSTCSFPTFVPSFPPTPSFSILFWCASWLSSSSCLLSHFSPSSSWIWLFYSPTPVHVSIWFTKNKLFSEE